MIAALIRAAVADERLRRCQGGRMIYALNLFDLADNDDYLGYAKASPEAVAQYGGRVVALGHRGEEVQPGATGARAALVLVEWPDRAALDAYRADFPDLHPLRENGTENYLWWTFEALEDLRPLLRDR